MVDVPQHDHQREDQNHEGAAAVDSMLAMDESGLSSADAFAKQPNTMLHTPPEAIHRVHVQDLTAWGLQRLLGLHALPGLPPTYYGLLGLRGLQGLPGLPGLPGLFCVRIRVGGDEQINS